MPATEFSSATASAGMPISAARSISSSGCEPPARKLKFEVADSSAKPAASGGGAPGPGRGGGRGLGFGFGPGRDSDVPFLFMT